MTGDGQVASPIQKVPEARRCSRSDRPRELESVAAGGSQHLTGQKNVVTVMGHDVVSSEPTRVLTWLHVACRRDPFMTQAPENRVHRGRNGPLDGPPVLLQET